MVVSTPYTSQGSYSVICRQISDFKVTSPHPAAAPSRACTCRGKRPSSLYPPRHSISTGAPSHQPSEITAVTADYSITVPLSAATSRVPAPSPNSVLSPPQCVYATSGAPLCASPLRFTTPEERALIVCCGRIPHATVAKRTAEERTAYMRRPLR